MRNLDTGQTISVSSSGDGVFRILNLLPGRYSLRAERDGFQPIDRSGFVLNAGEVFAAEFAMLSVPAPPKPELPEPPLEPPYRNLPAAPPEGLPEILPPQIIPPRERVFTPVPDRWKFDWPDYHRYGPRDEVPYVKGHWYDPFNRNKLKGDYPIFGQSTFLSLNLVSDTAVTGRKLPIPSGLGSDDPDSAEFFGRMGQFALSQNFSFSATDQRHNAGKSGHSTPHCSCTCAMKRVRFARATCSADGVHSGCSLTLVIRSLVIPSEAACHPEERSDEGSGPGRVITSSAQIPRFARDDSHFTLWANR